MAEDKLGKTRSQEYIDNLTLMKNPILENMNNLQLHRRFQDMIEHQPALVHDAIHSMLRAEPPKNANVQSSLILIISELCIRSSIDLESMKPEAPTTENAIKENTPEVVSIQPELIQLPRLDRKYVDNGSEESEVEDESGLPK